MDTVTDLASFIHDRLDEEEREAALFHELDCPVPPSTGHISRCGCPCPARILNRVAIHRQILQHCEQRIKHEQEKGLCWPLDSILAFQTMKAFALPFELHPAWRDSWYL
ncbi:DUF6221 family protein [Streptomyces sp. NPDC057757]|uniref:DUF6221 family protein n=1 Tax=Streptomyces sp. NPDC057757 TaxID=3346241 RepID=UPI0036944B21